jgi:hypothetical protein
MNAMRLHLVLFIYSTDPSSSSPYVRDAFHALSDTRPLQYSEYGTESILRDLNYSAYILQDLKRSFVICLLICLFSAQDQISAAECSMLS